MIANIKNEKAEAGLESFTGEFFYDRIKELADMKKKLAQKDLESVRQLAHKWKGFSSPYGFNHLEVLSASLEKNAEENRLDESSMVLGQISEYLAAKRKILKISTEEKDYETNK